MIADDLYRELIRRGVKFSIQGDLLTFTAPKGAISNELMALMKRHKAAIICLVKADSGTSDSVHPTSKSYLAGYGQEALWLIHQGDPTSSSYHTAAAIRLLSHIDIDAMQRALNKLVLRHDVLRTTFEQRELRLYACVREATQADFTIIDASQLNRKQLHEAIQREHARPFDLENGPLLRTRLYKEDDERSVIVLTLHHIIFDATSLWILQNELQALYSAEVSGNAALLPANSATYEDFANWQRTLPETEAGKKQWKYWQTELANDPTPAELTWSHPRPLSGKRDCATYKCQVDESLRTGLRTLSKQLNATPFSTALAAFQTLVYRYTGQPDSVVGTTTNGRTQPRFATGIGYYVNVLPIRSQISSGMKFSELVEQTKQRMLGAIQAGDFPFPLMVQRLNPVRISNAAPLCRMVFGLQKPHSFSEVSQLLNDADETVMWGGLKAQAYELEQQEGQFDFTFELYESSNAFSCVVKYDRNLMTDAAVERLTAHFLQLLEGCVKDPYKELDAYDLLTRAEQERLLHWSSGPSLPSPNADHEQPSSTKRQRYDTIWSKSVRDHAQKIALIFRDKSWTYQELDQWSTSVAHQFLKAGVKPGDRVVVSIVRQPLAPVCLLAAIKCGAAYVPVAPDSPKHRFDSILLECKPKIVVSQQNVEDFLTIGDSPWGGVDFCSDYPAYVLYTSGSSGIPKGVEVSQSAIAQHVESMASVYEMKPEDRVLQFCDLTFDPSLEQFLTPWSVGAAVVMRPETMYTGDTFWRTVDEQRVSVANLPPSFFNECSQFITGQTSLRLMIVGGDVFPTQSLSKWKNFGGRLLNAYGPTEAVVTATTKEILSFEPSQRISIGRPKPGSTAYVLDARGQVAPVGVPGELALGGPMLARGYIGDAASTNHRFQLFNIDEREPVRVYRTGDLAKWNDDGEIEFLGRIDRQIKIRGFRAEPGEVESALLEYPGVKDAVVVLAEEKQHLYLAAYVLTIDGLAPDHDKMLLHLKSRLPNYMIPERFAVLPEWPLNDAGKIATNRLPIIQKPDHTSKQRYVAPRNALETVLASVWKEVLEVDSVGIHDDFYMLGGGSLQSLRIISRLREWGISPQDETLEMGPHLLFQYVTIAELSTLLRMTKAADSAVARAS